MTTFKTEGKQLFLISSVAELKFQHVGTEMSEEFEKKKLKMLEKKKETRAWILALLMLRYTRAKRPARKRVSCQSAWSFLCGLGCQHYWTEQKPLQGCSMRLLMSTKTDNTTVCTSLLNKSNSLGGVLICCLSLRGNLWSIRDKTFKLTSIQNQGYII